MYYTTQHEFEQLKQYFDLNKPYEGANFLNMLLQRAADFTDEYDAPFKIGDGLEFVTDPYSLKPQLRIKDSGVDVRLVVDGLLKEISFLKACVADLQKMHQEGGNHIPPIISTKEQAVALQEKLGKEERVLIHTTFDKALRAFE